MQPFGQRRVWARNFCSRAVAVAQAKTVGGNFTGDALKNPVQDGRKHTEKKQQQTDQHTEHDLEPNGGTQQPQREQCGQSTNNRS